MKISVVIPCYNSEQYLAEALQSVIGQTRPAHEIIVVDDGSQDASRAIAERMGAILLRNTANAGPSAARNKGIQRATGDCIAFLDSDDYWDPHHLAVLYDLSQRHPSARVLFNGCRGVGNDFPNSCPPFLDGPPTLFWRLIKKNLVPQTAVLVFKDALTAVGCYNDTLRYAEDYDLWLRLSRRYSFVGSTVVTANYRSHDTQATRDLVRLAEGGWKARANTLTSSQFGLTDSEALRLQGDLLSVWIHDLTMYWFEGRRDVLDYLLSIVLPIEGWAEARYTWRLRRRYLWYPWIVSYQLFSRFPAPLRNSIRYLRQRLRGHRHQRADARP